MRRDVVVAQVEPDFVDIAPRPALGWIITLDDGMVCGMEMLARVTMGRLIATADMPADEADAKVDPCVADPQTLFAAGSAWEHAANPAKV